MILNRREDGSEQHTGKREECRESRQLRQSVESSRQRAEEGDNRHDRREDDCAGSVVGDGVQVLGADQAVEALNECVVEHKHKGSEPPSDAAVEEEHLSNIANITDLGVTEAELPDHKRSVQDQSGNDHGQDKTRDQTQD